MDSPKHIRHQHLMSKQLNDSLTRKRVGGLSHQARITNFKSIPRKKVSYVSQIVGSDHTNNNGTDIDR